MPSACSSTPAAANPSPYVSRRSGLCCPEVSCWGRSWRSGFRFRSCWQGCSCRRGKAAPLHRAPTAHWGTQCLQCLRGGAPRSEVLRQGIGNCSGIGGKWHRRVADPGGDTFTHHLLAHSDLQQILGVPRGAGRTDRRTWPGDASGGLCV